MNNTLRQYLNDNPPYALDEADWNEMSEFFAGLDEFDIDEEEYFLWREDPENWLPF